MLQRRTSPAKRYMRRTLQIIALVGTLLIGIIALALIVSQTPWFRDWLRKYAVRQAGQYVNGTVSIGSLGGNLFYGVQLGDVDDRRGRRARHHAEVRRGQVQHLRSWSRRASPCARSGSRSRSSSRAATPAAGTWRGWRRSRRRRRTGRGRASRCRCRRIEIVNGRAVDRRSRAVVHLPDTRRASTG